jgi:hypothetical protein
MRIGAMVLVLAGLSLAGEAAGQGTGVGLGAQACWRSGAQATTSCVRRMTALAERGELSRTEVLEMLGLGSRVASGAAVADFLVALARSRELVEMEQTAYISLAARLSGERNRERALTYLAAHARLSSHNVVALLDATEGISSPRRRSALLMHIFRTQVLDGDARGTLSRGGGG